MTDLQAHNVIDIHAIWQNRLIDGVVETVNIVTHHSILLFKDYMMLLVDFKENTVDGEALEAALEKTVEGLIPNRDFVFLECMEDLTIYVKDANHAIEILKKIVPTQIKFKVEERGTRDSMLNEWELNDALKNLESFLDN